MNATTARRLTHTVTSLSFLALLLAPALQAQGSAKANYKLANKFSNDFVSQFIHSTSVSPQWIGETDGFWYEYQTARAITSGW